MTDYPKREYEIDDRTWRKIPPVEDEHFVRKQTAPITEKEKLEKEIRLLQEKTLRADAARAKAEVESHKIGWGNIRRARALREIERHKQAIKYFTDGLANAEAALIAAEREVEELANYQPPEDKLYLLRSREATHRNLARGLEAKEEELYQLHRRVYLGEIQEKLKICKENYAKMRPAVLRCEGFRDDISFEDTVSTLQSSIAGIREYWMQLDEDYLYDCKRLGKEPNPHFAERYNQALADPRWLPPGYEHWLDEGEYFDYEEGRIYRYDGQTPRRELPPEPQEPLWPPRSAPKTEPLTENTAPQDLDLFTRLAEGDID